MFNNLFSAASISATGMSAERMRMETVAHNIANANSTHSVDGGAYRRKQLVFSSLVNRNADGSSSLAGVEVIGQEADSSELPKIHIPDHPDADENGYVEMPNVKLPNEMVDLITASRSYEANLKALTSFKEMIEQTLMLLRVS
ncbi:MAG: flagellar basal body rod protein FlgC [Mariniblastus sp.]